MIRIANGKIETPMALKENSPLSLVIENPAEYYRTVAALLASFEGEDSEFTFWDDAKEFKPSEKGEAVCNLFSFGSADKKIISLLYKRLYAEFLAGDFLLAYNELGAAAERFLLSLFEKTDIPLTYEVPSPEEFFKFYSVKPVKDEESLLEKLISYVNVFAELKNVSFLVFVGLKAVLSVEDLERFYRHCELYKVSLMLIESERKKSLKEERTIIITEDLCEIVENF